MFKNDRARATALAENLTKYEGRPCGRCMTTERYTSSGACVSCALKRVAQSYRPNLDTARGTAFVAQAIAYQGPACRTCLSTERYTSSGACVHCAKAAVAQRGDGRPRRKYEHRLKHGRRIPLQPDNSRCECCGDVAKLVIDHDHFLESIGFPGEETFRGWVCYGCNIGIGRLGDSIAGVQLALDYLKRNRS